MIFHKASEERKWKQWKEQEERILRESGVSESVIQRLRELDWQDFNTERRYWEHFSPNQETLLLSPILDFSNAEVLLDAFGENYMTAKIAENLVDSNVTINKSIFTAAWEYVDEKGKKTLMFKCLSILEAADFENCFSELSQWYSGFCDRSKKHSVELPNNEESQRLAKRLQEVSYITSYKLQEKEVYDSVTETKKKKSTFVCWIKAIKG